MEAATPSRADFFSHLARLPIAVQANTSFDRLFKHPPSATLADTLYRETIGHALQWLNLPRSVGGLNWEWRPLLLIQGEVDPFYFTDGQLSRRLAECPPMGPEARAALLQVIKGFLNLRRSGHLDRVTALVSTAFQRQWVAIFPPEFAWPSLDILSAVGLCPIGSAAGFRSLRRFSAGEFAAPLTPESLIVWEQACDRAGPESPTEPGAQPRAGFLAAAFAGELSALGIQGPCGEVPHCDRCALRSDCAWATAATPSAREGTAGTLARARVGRAEQLGLDVLLEALFDISADQREQLRSRLTGLSLRQLAAKSAVELEEWMRNGSSTAPVDPARMLLLFEVCKRFGDERLQPGAAFGGAQEVFQHFRLRFRDLKQERFLIVLLDVKKRYLNEVLVTQGGLASSPVYAREVFAPAVRERAAFVLLVHNHPSGDPTPSTSDLKTTEELAALGQMMGIPILDHVILGGEGFVSLRETGLVDL